MLIQGNVEAVAFLTSNSKEVRILTLVVAEVLLQTAAWLEMTNENWTLDKHNVQSQRKQLYKSDWSNNDPQHICKMPIPYDRLYGFQQHRMYFLETSVLLVAVKGIERRDAISWP